MGFLKKAFLFVVNPTQPRTILVILLLLAAVPLTVVISQKQQEIRQRAAERQPIPSSECRPPYSGYLGCLTKNGCANVGRSSDVSCSDENVQEGVYCYKFTKQGQACSANNTNGTCNDQGQCVITLIPIPPPAAPPQPPAQKSGEACPVGIKDGREYACRYDLNRNTPCLGSPGWTKETTFVCQEEGVSCYSQSVSATAPAPTTSTTRPKGYDCGVGNEPREFYCSATRPDVPNKERCNALLTKIAGTNELLTTCKDIDPNPEALCWQCPPITPTPTPSSQCGVNDCGGPGACAADSTCAQKGSGRKNCECVANSSLTPTATPEPIQPPPPTSTPAPGNVILALSLSLEEIGKNRNLPSSVAKSPVTIEVLSHGTEPETIVLTKKESVVYDSTDGKFQRDVDLGALSPGDYQIKIKIDKYLKKLVPAILKVKATTDNQTIPVSTTPLNPILAGDINNDGSINSLDYNAVIGCFGLKKNTPSCTDKSSDINYDGAIDGIDHNITIRNFGKTDD